jgi:hypothetical protein
MIDWRRIGRRRRADARPLAATTNPNRSDRPLGAIEIEAQPVHKLPGTHRGATTRLRAERPVGGGRRWLL